MDNELYALEAQAQEVRADKARHDATTANRPNQVGECFNSTLN